MGLCIWGAKVVINMLLTNFPKGQPLRFEFLTKKTLRSLEGITKRQLVEQKLTFQYRIGSNTILVNSSKL